MFMIRCFNDDVLQKAYDSIVKRIQWQAWINLFAQCIQLTN